MTDMSSYKLQDSERVEPWFGTEFKKSGTVLKPQIINYPDPLYTSKDALHNIFPGWYDTPLQYITSGDMIRPEGDNIGDNLLPYDDGFDFVGDCHMEEKTDGRQVYWPGTVPDVGIVKMGEIKTTRKIRSDIEITKQSDTICDTSSSYSNDFMIPPISKAERRLISSGPRLSCLY
jgi:hypothetical protein